MYQQTFFFQNVSPQPTPFENFLDPRLNCAVIISNARFPLFHSIQLDKIQFTGLKHLRMEGNCVQKFVNPSVKSICKKNVHLVEMSIVYKSVTSLHFSDISMKHHPEEITQTI